MNITDEQIEKLSLTPDQLKAAKKVYAAMKAAGKLGVHFWDDYGTLSCYNDKKIQVPIMEDFLSYSEKCGDEYFEANSGTEGHLVVYYENLKNFFAGNADDPYYAKIK